MIKAVLFDLDGTLLPMDQDTFLKAYFGGISAHLAPFGYVPEELIKAIWKGTMAMIKNNGEKSNEAVFWDFFSTIYGEKVRDDEPKFEEFYREKFPAVKAVCGYNPKSRELLDLLHDRIYLLITSVFISKKLINGNAEIICNSRDHLHIGITSILFPTGNSLI